MPITTKGRENYKTLCYTILVFSNSHVGSERVVLYIRTYIFHLEKGNPPLIMENMLHQNILTSNE